jgi:hypothetical protein
VFNDHLAGGFQFRDLLDVLVNSASREHYMYHHGGAPNKKTNKLVAMRRFMELLWGLDELDREWTIRLATVGWLEPKLAGVMNKFEVDWAMQYKPDAADDKDFSFWFKYGRRIVVMGPSS